MVTFVRIALRLIEDALALGCAAVPFDRISPRRESLTATPAGSLHRARRPTSPGRRGYLIHDRDSIFARHLDDSIRALGLKVLRSPFWSSKANAICKRVIGTLRRECLDWMIPLSEAHLRSILRDRVARYNGGRPHSALGPGVPGPPAGSARGLGPESRRLWTPDELVRAKSVLGGLHHQYSV
jgi:hypothetical protein